LVPRPRLIERLNAGLRGVCTLVSAPAGFGKTTLISEWHTTPTGRQYPLAWLSLDQDDNDPARFLTYLVAALETLPTEVSQSTGLADAQALLQSRHRPPLKVVLTTLVNGLSSLPTDFMMVLDDYHVITAEPIHEAVTFLLDHLPPRMRLVIATRAEGWIAGLQLAALALQGTLAMPGHKDAHGFIESFTGTNRYILDYLTEEELQRQTPDVRSFLLETCVLDQLSGLLCDAVTRHSDSQVILDQLDRANLFVTPLDDARKWYHYHRLFSDLLRGYLSDQPPDQVKELHRVVRAERLCARSYRARAGGARHGTRRRSGRASSPQPPLAQ